MPPYALYTCGVDHASLALGSFYLSEIYSFVCRYVIVAVAETNILTCFAFVENCLKHLNAEDTEHVTSRIVVEFIITERFLKSTEHIKSIVWR